MSEELNDVLNVVQRWESLGLLEGLPIQEKVELAQIYDNATRLLLSEISLKKIPKKISDTMDEVFMPICRRLYKRVGPNFDLGNMMGNLLLSVDENFENLSKFDPNHPEKNPIIDFCVNFADTYEDETINKNVLTDEEYTLKVKKLLLVMEEILLNENIVSYINKDNGEYEINLAKNKRTTQQTRFWNQSAAKNFLISVLSEINKNF
jgi:hypothetical protein